MSEWTIDTLKDHILTLIAETRSSLIEIIAANNARHEQKQLAQDQAVVSALAAQEKAVAAALAAQKEATAAAFAASERAITKAEIAQTDYNQRSNEFRGQLDDQAKLLMARLEALGLFRAVDEKLAFIQKNFDDKLEALRLSNEKIFDAQTKEIAGLREYRSEIAGKGTGADRTVQYIGLAIGTLVSLAVIGGIIVSIAYAIRG